MRRDELPGELPNERWERYAALLQDISRFSELIIEKPLRSYQLEPASAIMRSIIRGEGLTFAVMMCRQAGKNELSAQLEAYLMNCYQRRGGQIVKASPTFKPQTVNSILRLLERLDNDWNRRRARRREGYMVELRRARTLFFSAGAQADVVGATADVLLECDEAQDVRPDKWGKDFRPMGASTNVTTVMYGTAWTSSTLLANTIKYLRRLEARDGRRRVFAYDADVVSAEVPLYAEYVAGEVERLGRDHPLVKTQYYLEEIDAQGKLFTKLRRALMRGDHGRLCLPRPGQRYALLVDVAGEDEQAGSALDRLMLQHPKRDATALTVVEVDVEYGRLPTYRVVDRKLWVGVRHTQIYNELLALFRRWKATWLVVDATGVGAGLASFLGAQLGEVVIPVLFSPKVKSDMGWEFLGVIETGRYREYVYDRQIDSMQFWHEVEHCDYEIGTGPGKPMKWGVWEAAAYDGQIAYGHDDLLLSAALVTVLDKQKWPGTGPSGVVRAWGDELEEIDEAEW